MVKGPEDRSAVLAKGATTIGATWANGWCQQMVRDGRAVSGGWPGTMPEAQWRVAAYFHAELARRGMLELSPEELAATTRDAYEKAKLRWLTVQKETAPLPKSARATGEKSP